MCTRITFPHSGFVKNIIDKPSLVIELIPVKINCYKMDNQEVRFIRYPEDFCQPTPAILQGHSILNTTFQNILHTSSRYVEHQLHPQPQIRLRCSSVTVRSSPDLVMLAKRVVRFPQVRQTPLFPAILLIDSIY
jgi:hypothetical protein